MPMRLPAGLAIAVLAPVSLAADTLRIEHAPVGCVIAEKFPRLEARFAPGDAVAKAKVLFQTEGARHWYAVAMKPEGSAFSGVLPRPRKSLKAYRYYIEATDTAMGVSRTPEYTTTVAEGPAACQGKMVAGALGSASVALEIPVGAPAVPVGFSSSGVSAATAAGTTTGASAGGGGIPTGVLIGGGVAAAGAAAAVVVATRPKDYEGTFSGELSWGPSPNCSVTLAFRGSMQIALEESGGSVSGDGYGVITEQTVSSRSPACSGDFRIGDTIAGPITGTASNFMFGQPESVNAAVGQGNCGGGRIFVGSLNGGVSTGTLTLSTFCVGGANPYRGSTTVPITLRR